MLQPVVCCLLPKTGVCVEWNGLEDNCLREVTERVGRRARKSRFSMLVKPGM
jgi:hypothetical protein